MTTELLPPIPEHLATLGMFDGQIGMATLGFIIEPDIVPRFPTEGLLEAEKLLGFVSEQELYALVEGVGAEMADVEAQDLAGLFAPQTLTAAVDEVQGSLEATVGDEEMGIEMSEADFDGEVTEANFAAEVDELELEALVEDDDDMTAVLEEAPGEGD